MELTSITPSPTALRALAHPVRVSILFLLRVDGPATATTLAERLGLNTGATSYHLRQLAQHGFVQEATELGDRRDRWWRASHTSTRTERDRFHTPEDQQALDAYLQSVAVFYTQNLQASVEDLPLVPQEWRDASTMSDYWLRLTPAKARALVDRLHELVAETNESDEGDRDESGAAEEFVVQLQGFPRPGLDWSAR